MQSSYTGPHPENFEFSECTDSYIFVAFQRLEYDIRGIFPGVFLNLMDLRTLLWIIMPRPDIMDSPLKSIRGCVTSEAAKFQNLVLEPLRPRTINFEEVSDYQLCGFRSCRISESGLALGRKLENLENLKNLDNLDLGIWHGTWTKSGKSGKSG